MRIDAELFKIVDDRIRITLQPNKYAWLPINKENKHFKEYSKGKPSELLITNQKVCLTYMVGEREKPLGRERVAADLNFNTIDFTQARIENGVTKLENVMTKSLRRIAQIQNDFFRMRQKIQQHVKSPQKKEKKA
jgi:putative transposase